MGELLSSGKINNRLLCELAAHPNFRRLMIDMEICIDQIANKMCIRDSRRIWLILALPHE